MAISIKCATCGKRYQAADHMAGRRVRCKHCGTTFQLPAEPTSSDPFEQPQDADADAPIALAAGAVLDDEQGLRQPPEPTSPFDNPAPGFDPQGDMDAVFQDAFQEFTPSRGNTPFVFPGSRQLDRWLPTVLIVICVAWLAYLTLGAGTDEPPWVGSVRLLILLMTFTGVVFPICLKGVRMAARKLNYDLPSGAPLRAFATFLLPVTIGCALWLTKHSVAGFIFGNAMGLIVALPVMWLLFRIRQDDAPVSLGYGAAAFGSAVLASAVLLFVLNLIIVGVVRASKADHSLAISPFGPGFSWDPPAVVEKPKKVVTVRPRRVDPVAPTTSKAFSDGDDGDQPSTAIARTDPDNPSPPLPSDPPTSVEPGTVSAADAQAQVTPDVKVDTDLTAKNTIVSELEHGPIVAEVFQRVSGEMDALVHPLLPGNAVAVVKKSPRANEDRVELWSTTTWRPQSGVSFARPAAGIDNYQINSDGTLLARLADFPYVSAQVYSFEKEVLLRPFIKIDTRGPAPHIAGFPAPDELLMLFAAGPQSSIEVWDINRIKRKQRIEVSGMRTDPGYYTLSRDGKYLGIICRESSDDANGRVEIFNLATGVLARRIIIDEMEWNANVRPAGISFNDEADKIAVLFERQGQGLFLCWGANNDIPLYQHVYPGGLLPEGIDISGFQGQSFALVDNARAWLLYGASIFDTANGKLLGDLGIKDVRSQKVISRDTVMLVQSIGKTKALLEVRLDINRARRELVSNR